MQRFGVTEVRIISRLKKAAKIQEPLTFYFSRVRQNLLGIEGSLLTVEIGLRHF